MFAQHQLGIEYQAGELVEQDLMKALAWYRESVRNGNAISYAACGEILALPEFKYQNKLFALVNFMGAYQHGALFC